MQIFKTFFIENLRVIQLFVKNTLDIVYS